MSRLTLVFYIVVILLLVYELYLAKMREAEFAHVFDGNMMPAARGGDHLPRVSVSPTQSTSAARPGANDMRSTAHDSGAGTNVAAARERELNIYRNIDADASSFNLAEAQMKGAHAFESDVIVVESPPIIMPPTTIPKDAAVTRTSAAAAGGSADTILNVTGGTIERPLVDPPTPSPVPIVLPISAPSGPSERPDHRCGPIADGAKCGPGRCCSIYGWCGSPGEAHCTAPLNMPLYNGVGSALPQGISNGDVLKCANGTIYRIENNQKRLYPNLSIYEKNGRPAYMDIDCKILDAIVPGTSYT